MYFNILKKDLKRKKSMNIILLLFTILAAMFVSSGISNVVTVMNGTEYFIDKAGIGDFFVITQNGDRSVEELLDESEHVSDYTYEKSYFANKGDIKVAGNTMVAKNNVILMQSYNANGMKYFLSNNEELKGIKKGEVYVTAGFLDNNDAVCGDTLKLEYHGLDKEYKIAGEIKDALFGSDMMGNTRILINEADFAEYEANENLKPYEGYIFNIKSDDVRNLKSELGNAKNVLFADGRGLLKLCYVMEMIVAMIVLVLSVLLCIISFILLKFVITFTISEEVREIGVMKAIGIKNRKIRSLYLTKYLMMSLVGGIIGFIAGIPFGHLLIDSVSKKMYLGQDYGILLNIVGAIVVILIMTGFAYKCTGKVKKYTPVDAIREGQTGERYSKKSKMSLAKSKKNNAFFLALNDVSSAPRRFLTIILSFAICSVFVFGVVLVTDTMKSDSLIESFGKKSDVYITDTKLVDMDFMSEDGNQKILDYFEDVEKDMKSLDMPAKVSMEIWYKYPVTVNGRTTSITLQQNALTDTTEYKYLEGSAPQNDGEVAITSQIADELEIEIGDTIIIDFGTEKKACMVVAYFQTMNQLGSVIKLHQDAPTNMACASAMMAIQLDFFDKPSNKEITKRIEKIKDFYDINDVFDATGYCDDCMGVADTMDAVAKLLLVITCLVVILVTVLMERSFISDEKSQIALLKAVGFSDGFVVRWHLFRFTIVAVAAEIIALIFTYPVTKLWCDPIFKMMGAVDVSYVIKPLSIIVIYPGIILIISILSSWITSLHTKKIKCNDVRNME